MLRRRISLSLSARGEKALVVVRRVVAGAANAMATREVAGGEGGGGPWAHGELHGVAARTARRPSPAMSAAGFGHLPVPDPLARGEPGRREKRRQEVRRVREGNVIVVPSDLL